MLHLDIQDLSSVKLETLDHADSTMAGRSFGTVRIELRSTQGDAIRLTLFGNSVDALMTTLDKAFREAVTLTC